MDLLIEDSAKADRIRAQPVFSAMAESALSLVLPFSCSPS
jgi:hypothetical protein